MANSLSSSLHTLSSSNIAEDEATFATKRFKPTAAQDSADDSSTENTLPFTLARGLPKNQSHPVVKNPSTLISFQAREQPHEQPPGHRNIFIICDVCMTRKMHMHSKGNIIWFRDAEAKHSRIRCDVCMGPMEGGPETLRRYKSASADPYKCHACNALFSRSDRLLSHCHVHHAMKPYVCDICGVSMTRKNCLASHMETHHKLHLGKSQRKHVGQAPNSKYGKMPAEVVIDIIRTTASQAPVLLQPKEDTKTRELVPYPPGALPISNAVSA
jgi:hypothetical protein